MHQAWVGDTYRVTSLLLHLTFPSFWYLLPCIPHQQPLLLPPPPYLLARHVPLPPSYCWVCVVHTCSSLCGTVGSQPCCQAALVRMFSVAVLKKAVLMARLQAHSDVLSDTMCIMHRTAGSRSLLLPLPSLLRPYHSCADTCAGSSLQVIVPT